MNICLQVLISSLIFEIDRMVRPVGASPQDMLKSSWTTQVAQQARPPLPTYLLPYQTTIGGRRSNIPSIMVTLQILRTGRKEAITRRTRNKATYTVKCQGLRCEEQLVPLPRRTGMPLVDPMHPERYPGLISRVHQEEGNTYGV